MLQIRPTQLQVFQRALLAKYVEETVRHLLGHFPDPCASVLGGPEEVREFVERGIGKAAECNVNTPSAITALLELWLQFGEDFQRSPLRAWTLNILSHPELPGTAKVDEIRDRHLELTGGCIMVVY